nr:TraI [Cloning vector pMR361-K]
MRSIKKSDFAELVKYITDEQGKTERLGHVRVTNCEANTLPAVMAEVMATQHGNTRSEADKTYHLLVSFRAGEKPDAETLRAIEDRICAGLGFAEHQRVSAVHHDTDNLHIHIAINKIHPTRNTIHEPYRAYRALADLCATLERDYGLERDNHETRQRVSENRANDMERHAGVESLVGWILYAGRIVAGITGATGAVAGAYIADITDGEDRARHFGLMSACFGVGMVAGPVAGGLLGAISLLPRAFR